LHEKPKNPKDNNIIDKLGPINKFFVSFAGRSNVGVMMVIFSLNQPLLGPESSSRNSAVDGWRGLVGGGGWLQKLYSTYFLCKIFVLVI
jgi:hypothetical protein